VTFSSMQAKEIKNKSQQGERPQLNALESRNKVSEASKGKEPEVEGGQLIESGSNETIQQGLASTSSGLR
jgi:hypothetical protein